MKVGLMKLGLLIIASGVCFSQSMPTPIISTKLNSIASDQAIRQLHTVTVAFLSDSQLAIAFQNGPVSRPDLEHVMATFNLKVGSLSVLARRNGMPVDALFNGLRRTANGQLVVFTLPPLDRDVRIYDANLTEKHSFRARPFVFVSPTGRTVAVAAGTSWNVFRTDPISLLTSLAGSPLAVSDDAFAIQDGESILIKGFDGTQKGSIRAPKKCVNHADFIGNAKLYLELCRQGWTHEIIDLSGRSLVSVQLPKGWGHHQADIEGDRMVFDVFTESMWASIKALKDFEDTPDGEAIRVVDTQNGNTCFSLDLPMDKAHEGPMHASISPSGKLVAVVDDEAISVFELPSGRCVLR